MNKTNKENMNKNNFSTSDLSAIIFGMSKASAAGYSFTLNRAGNLKVFKNGANEHFVLYHNTNATKDGYLWRRHTVSYYSPYSPVIYPLNMKRVKTAHEYTYSDGSKHVYYSDWRGTKDCEFKNIEDAIKYFINYLVKTGRL